MLEDNLEDRTRKKMEMSWCLWVAVLIFIHENVWLRDSITWKPTSFFHAVVVQAPKRKSYETALYMAPWSLSQRLTFSKDSAIAKDSQSLLKEQRSWGSSLMITPKFRELSFFRFYISSKVAGRESFLALEKGHSCCVAPTLCQPCQCLLWSSSLYGLCAYISTNLLFASKASKRHITGPTWEQAVTHRCSGLNSGYQLK